MIVTIQRALLASHGGGQGRCWGTSDRTQDSPCPRPMENHLARSVRSAEAENSGFIPSEEGQRDRGKRDRSKEGGGAAIPFRGHEVFIG